MGWAWRWGAVWSVGLVLALCPIRAEAQHFARPEAPTAEDQADARDLYQEATGVLNAGKLDEGIALLQQSYAKSGNFLPLYALAVAFSRAKDYGGAYAAAKQVLKEHRDLPADLRASAEQLLREARAQIGILWIQGVPPGAGTTIALDDNDVAFGNERPVVRAVTPGEHHVRATREDRDFDWHGAVAAGDDVDIRVKFAAKDDGAPAAPPGKPTDDHDTAFYESPWFWVATGAAVLLTAGIIIAVTQSDGGLEPRGKNVLEL